jgi:hypothetical protein
MAFKAVTAFWVSALFAVAASAQTNINQVSQAAAAGLKSAAASQQKIDSLDDEQRLLLQTYRNVLAESEQLRVYNQQLVQIIANQRTELNSIDKQINDIERTQQGIMPLMARMLDALDLFVQLDLPFLLDERQTRIKQLRELMVSADVTVAEKYRRVLEAYQIELEYGRTIEAYREKTADGKLVDYLRLGRAALYYISLNAESAYGFDIKTRSWLELDSAYMGSLQKGLQVARKQAAPSLLTLPIRTLEH